MKCNQPNCGVSAAFRFRWPGKVEAGICEEHAPLLRGVAAAIGLSLELIPIEGLATQHAAERLLGIQPVLPPDRHELCEHGAEFVHRGNAKRGHTGWSCVLGCGAEPIISGGVIRGWRTPQQRVIGVDLGRPGGDCSVVTVVQDGKVVAQVVEEPALPTCDMHAEVVHVSRSAYVAAVGQNERSKQRLASCAAELKTALEEAAELRSQLALVRTPKGGVWYWQGDGDNPESLSCPVVMSAETLRGLLADAKSAERLRGERDEAMAEIAEVRRVATEAEPDLEGPPNCETLAGCVAALGRRYKHELERSCVQRAEIARLRTLPATVSVTRIEEAAEKVLGLIVREYDIDGASAQREAVLAILRSCTATADVEGVAKAMHDHDHEDDADGRSWQQRREIYTALAKRALAYLGVEAKPAEPRAERIDPPEPCVCKHDSAEHATGREGAIDGKCLHRDEVGDWCPCSKFRPAGPHVALHGPLVDAVVKAIERTRDEVNDRDRQVDGHATPLDYARSAIEAVRAFDAQRGGT